MRRGEILGLRWEDVDLERRILYVGETKTGMPRHVSISSRLGNVLVSLFQGESIGFVFVGLPGVGNRGKPFHDVRTSFENACRLAGIRDSGFTT